MTGSTATNATYMHIQAYMLASMHACMHTYINMCIYTHIYICDSGSQFAVPPPDVRSPTWRLQNYHRSRESHPIHDNDDVDDDDGDAYGDAATTPAYIYIYIYIYMMPVRPAPTNESPPMWCGVVVVASPVPVRGVVRGWVCLGCLGRHPRDI